MRQDDERIGLHEEHQREAAALREGGAFVEPRVNGAHACGVLGLVEYVVIASLNVERDEEQPGRFPAHVLAIFAGLHLRRERRRAEIAPPGSEPAALVLAIDPLVVAGNDHHFPLKARELLLARLKQCVVAGGPAGADVADVHDEIEPLFAVYVVDQQIEPPHFGGRVRRIAEHAEHHAGRGCVRATGEHAEK